MTAVAWRPEEWKPVSPHYIEPAVHALVFLFLDDGQLIKQKMWEEEDVENGDISW